MLVLQFGLPKVNLSSIEQPFEFIHFIALILDVVINFSLLVVYVYFFAMMIIYGYRAWMEVE